MAEQRDGLVDLEAVANGPDKATLRPLSFRRRELADDLCDRDLQSTIYSKSCLTVGDTLVFIKFPNNKIIYDATGFPLSDRHIVHREKLLATGSEQFKKILTSPDAQFKLQRRLGVVKDLPPGVQYVMDLTPPEEGDEALELTSALCCSLGVRKWYTAEKRCGVSRNLVGGHDETTELRLHGDLENFENEALEYCPIRHRTGIERLLQVIEGKDPRLDSAPKVWTLAVLAKHFGCAKVVEDHIISWVLADPNCRFVEILPEVTLRIGVMLENYQLTRSAFAVLVSEEALRMGTNKFFKNVAGPPPSFPFTLKKHTRLHRPMEDVDEDWVNIIQYASRPFFTRVNKTYKNLLSRDMAWLHNLPEYMKVTSFELWVCESHSNLADFWKDVILDLRNRVRDYVRGRLLFCIVATLEGRFARGGHANRIQEGYLEQPEVDFGQLYDSLNDQEKVMTRFFWLTMANLDWTTQPQSNQIYNPLATMHPFYGKNIEIAKAHGVAAVHTYELITLAQKLNAAIIDSCQGDAGYNGGQMPHEAYVAHHYSDDFITPPKKDLTQSVSNLNLDSPVPAPPQPEGGASPSAAKEAHATNSSADSINSDDKDWSAEVDGDWTEVPFGDVQEKSDVPTAAWVPTAQVAQHSTASAVEERFAQYWKEAASTNKVFPPASPTFKELQPKPTSWWCDEDPSTSKKPTAAKPANIPRVPEDCFIGLDCVFFSISKLLQEISITLANECQIMLDKGEMEFASVCDTLLCLSDEEFKYLPLWAGGLDDGSGGVFQDFVPPAERGGPSQPGPSYHTGSTLNSVASIDINFDGDGSVLGSYTEEGMDTSLVVDRGYSDQLDRRVVYSESEFPTENADSVVGGYFHSAAGTGMDLTDGTLSEDTLSLHDEHVEDGHATTAQPHDEIENDTFFFADEEGEDLDQNMSDYDEDDYDDRELTETED